MIKTILVHLTGSASDEGVTAEALRLARPFGAHLECVHVRLGKGQVISLAASGTVGAEMTVNVGEIANQLEKASNENARGARAAFEKLLASGGVAPADAAPVTGMSATFREREGDETDILIEELRGNDFGVFAGGGAENEATPAARVLLNAGRPLVLTPGGETRFPQTIAVAWKNTPQAARALAAAMPLLVKAKKVVLFSASEGPYEAGAATTRNVLSHLRWHGINAETREVLPGGRAASEAVLDAVAEEGADMLVMGAYSRTRLSETVFGGFTREVLSHTPLPAFLVH